MTQLLTLNQAATAVGVSKRTIFKLIGDGHLETIAVSPRSIRIRQSELERFLAAQTRTRPEAAQGPGRWITGNDGSSVIEALVGQGK